MTGPRRNLLLRAARRLWPRNRWARLLLVLVPLLVLLVLVDPIVGAVRLVVGLAEAVLRPILSDPGGRLVAVCISLLAGGLLSLHLLRNKLRSLRSGLVLRHHLDALGAYLRGDRRRARDLWLAIARGRGSPPSEYTCVREDACLKLARMALEDGRAGEALAWVLRVQPDGLPPALQRTQAQLRCRAVAATRDSLPESCRREIEAAVARWPDDAVLLRLQRDRALADGELVQAARVQERIWRAAEPAAAADERDTAVQLHLRAARAALAEDDVQRAAEACERARALDADAVAHSLLEGELRMRQDDLEGALRAWARVPGSAALTRCAEAVDVSPGRLTPRELLECCPTEGGLLLVARAHARLREPRRALRAARRAARQLGPTPTVSLVLAQVLREAGDPGADAFAAEAAARLLDGP